MLLAEIIGPDILIVLAVIALLFGSTRLPKLARSLGSASSEFRKGMEHGADDGEDKSGAATGSDAPVPSPLEVGPPPTEFAPRPDGGTAPSPEAAAGPALPDPSVSIPVEPSPTPEPAARQPSANTEATHPGSEHTGP